MKTDFQYSTDFLAMNAPELGNTCMHLICTAGEGSFVYNGHDCHIVQNDLAVIPMPARVSGIVAQPGMQVEWFAADYNYLQSLLPSNNYGIGGSISLNNDPIISLTGEQAAIILTDFRRIRDRMGDRHLLFYNELMGSLCLTMMYDIFDPHAQRDASEPHSNRTAYIVKQLMDLLSTGICRTERDVRYYAKRLNVSSKYLSATVKRVTGYSVSSFINRTTIPVLKKYLNDERLSLNQIADIMNFASLSYFSRYCTKHLGLSPSEYRKSLQPKGE